MKIASDADAADFFVMSCVIHFSASKTLPHPGFNLKKDGPSCERELYPAALNSVAQPL
jgi:hypothetical protein